jgi:hypothetical protein
MCFGRYGEALSPKNPVVEIYVPVTKNFSKGDNDERSTSFGRHTQRRFHPDVD